MHWLQTIRDNLNLTREELARYLQLSTHMIQSVELGRRQLPFESMRAAIVMYNAMKNSMGRDLIGDPPLEADYRIRRVKQLHRRCCRKLDLCAGKLKKMQNAYESARQSLGVYRLLAHTQTPAHHKDDLVRLQWAQQKVNETMQRVKDNDPTAQRLLAAEIASLKSLKQAIEQMPV